MMQAGKQVLTLPGWEGSATQHWQSRWEVLYGYSRVEQHDWKQPLRGDWMMQLEEAVLGSDNPVLLVAHSLGCHLVAAWAAYSRHTERVLAALLVAPPDMGLPVLTPLHSWRPAVRNELPFPSQVLASSNDPFCTLDQAAALASGWGSTLANMGACGHINADSELGDWPAGHQHLLELARNSRQADA